MERPKRVKGEGEARAMEQVARPDAARCQNALAVDALANTSREERHRSMDVSQRDGVPHGVPRGTPWGT